jgi:hypothetical protein
MSWLDFFQTTQSTCHINFGRDINANISPDEEELFNNSYEAFENKDILKAYEYFFLSLINYTQELPNNNIEIDINNNELNFIIYQGSAKIIGKIDEKSLKAESVMVKSKDASVALKRYILERNYQLTYSNYSSDEEYIKLKLYLDNITMSPQKVFFPLRELALNADFDKEHIKSEFLDDDIQKVTYLTPINQKEMQIKYNAVKKWIDETNKKVLTLPSNDNAGMQAFLYLNLLFKIDYLLVPKYKIYHKLSKKIQDYFSDEHPTIEAKNEELKRYAIKLKEMSYDDFSSNFYEAKYTFNPTDKSAFDEIVKFINESIIKIRWYKSNRLSQIIPVIYEYMTFYILYNYGLNSAQKDILHTLVEILNAPYFDELSCSKLYDYKNKSFAKKEIISKLQDIVEMYRQRYKKLQFDTDELNFNSLNEFNYSFYNIFKTLDFEEI